VRQRPEKLPNGVLDVEGVATPLSRACRRGPSWASKGSRSEGSSRRAG
jgi:hypothetical protein